MFKKRPHRSICTNIWKEVISNSLFHYFIFEYTGRTHIISLKSWYKMETMSRLYLKILNQYPLTFHICWICLILGARSCSVKLIQQTTVMVNLIKNIVLISVCVLLCTPVFWLATSTQYFRFYSTHWLLLFHSASTG